MTWWGVSFIGSGFAGGTDPVTGGPIPPLNIFGGNGIPTSGGLVLQVQPEPGTAMLAAFGAAVLLTFRRRARVGTGLAYQKDTHMKKLAATLYLAVLAAGAFAQGTINFVNAAGPAVRYDVNFLGPGQPLTSYPLLPPTAGEFYFALLTAPLGSTDPSQFSLAVYGTNLAVGGIIRGASSVPGWVPGTSRSFEVVGWDAASGVATYNPAWIRDPASLAASGLHAFGVSVIGSGFAGGIDPVTGGPIPPLNIFGGNGIPTTSAFVIYPGPEPGTAMLAAFGAAVLLTFRRRARVGTGLAGND